MKSLGIVLVVFLFLSVPAAAEGSPVEVRNPGFEVNGSHGQPAGWQVTGQPERVSADLGVFRSGLASLRIAHG